MRFVAVVITAVLGTTSPALAQSSRTFVGVVTDTMCGRDHTSMHVTPDRACVVECVRQSGTVKYALLDGPKTYALSDQKTPAKFAGRKVKVSGVLYTKTNILKVEKIEAAD